MRAGELRAGDSDAFAAAYMALLDRLPIQVMTGLTALDAGAIAAEAASASEIMMAAYAPARASLAVSELDGGPRQQASTCP